MANEMTNRHAKAERLIAEGRCHVLASVPGKLWMGVIVGDTGTYTVFDADMEALWSRVQTAGVVPARRGCQCKAFENSGQGTNRSCAHTDAAAKLRIASTSADDLFNMAAGL